MIACVNTSLEDYTWVGFCFAHKYFIAVEGPDSDEHTSILKNSWNVKVSDNDRHTLAY